MSFRSGTRNYAIVGIFVISMVVAAIAWIALLSGRTSPMDHYFIRYSNVTGLTEGTQILYEGYPVGLIDRIERIDGDAPHFRVEVSVRRDWRIPEDSVAEIRASGLLGGFVIDIDEGAAPTSLGAGAEIASQEAADVFATISEVAGDVDRLIHKSLEPLLQELGQGAPVVIDNLLEFTAQLNESVERINGLLSPENSARVENILANLENTSTEVARLTDGLSDTRAQLDAVLEVVEKLMLESEAELGRSVSDLQHTLETVARHVDAISHNLEVTTRNMNEFSRQLRENPGVLVRGRPSDDGAKTP